MKLPRAPIRRAVLADGPAGHEFVFATLRSYGIEPDPDGLDGGVMACGTSGDGPVAEIVADVEGRPVGSVALSTFHLHVQEALLRHAQNRYCYRYAIATISRPVGLTNTPDSRS